MRTLGEQGHDAIPASPRTAVNTLTGEGLAEVRQGAQVLVDVANSPSFADDAVMELFRTSTTNLLRAGAEAELGHHVGAPLQKRTLLPGDGARLYDTRLADWLAQTPPGRQPER